MYSPVILVIYSAGNIMRIVLIMIVILFYYISTMIIVYYSSICEPCQLLWIHWFALLTGGGKRSFFFGAGPEPKSWPLLLKELRLTPHGTTAPSWKLATKQCLSNF